MQNTPINIPSTGAACDQKTFRQLARSANWVPVWATVPADLLTPVSAFWKLGGNGAASAVSSGKALQPFSFL